MKRALLILHLVLIVVSSGVYADVGDFEEIGMIPDLKDLELPERCLNGTKGPVAQLYYEYAHMNYVASCENVLEKTLQGNEAAKKLGQGTVGEVWDFGDKRGFHIVPPFVRLEDVSESGSDVYPKISYYNIKEELEERLRAIYELFYYKCDADTVTYRTMSSVFSNSYILKLSTMDIEFTIEDKVFYIGEPKIRMGKEIQTCKLQYKYDSAEFRCGETPIDPRTLWYVRHYQKDASENSLEGFNADSIKLISLSDSIRRVAKFIHDRRHKNYVGELTVWGHPHARVSISSKTCLSRENRGQILAAIEANGALNSDDTVGSKYNLNWSTKGIHQHLMCLRDQVIDSDYYSLPLVKNGNEKEADYSIDYVDGFEFLNRLEEVDTKCSEPGCKVRTAIWNQVGQGDITVRQHCEMNMYLFNNIWTLVRKKDAKTIDSIGYNYILYDGQTEEFLGSSTQQFDGVALETLRNDQIIL